MIPVPVRDSGLQPERTALSWHRTAFSSLVLALVIIRGGVVHNDRMCLTVGSIAALLSLVLVLITFYRQKTITRKTNFISSSSVIEKWLICGVAGLNALALILHSLPW